MAGFKQNGADGGDSGLAFECTEAVARQLFQWQDQ